MDEFDVNSHTFGLVASVGLYDALTRTDRYQRFASEQRTWLLGGDPWGVTAMVGVGHAFPNCMQHQVANLSGTLDGSPPIDVGAVVNGPNGKDNFEGGLGGFQTGMRHCTSAARHLSLFDGHGSRYVDDVRAWQTDEPALDMTGVGHHRRRGPAPPARPRAAALTRRHPVKPGTPRILRGINDRAALDLLLEHGPLSRSQLGDLTGLSKPTTGQLLARLEDAGLVITSGITNGGPGPRAQLYAVNPDAAHVVALDVTPARILAAVADLTGRTVGEYELRTPRRPGPDAVSHVVQAMAGAATSAGLPVSSLRHLAIGTPGAFDPTTRRLRYARHLPGWHDPHLLERLADEVGIPIHVDNDVNLAAVAELPAGVARGVEDFVLLWADEGLGAAIVIDGRLRGGATGGAGEVGFLPLPGTPLVRDVRRGNAGAFQELAGGPQVLALARSSGSARPPRRPPSPPP